MRTIFWIVTLITLCSCNDSTLEIDMDDTFHLKRDGATMPVHVYGNGTSNTLLIILHGGPGSASLPLRVGDFAEELENNYMVAYWSQRGAEMSQGKFNREELNVEAMVEDIRALIALVENRYSSDLSIFLLGHSWGGMLGTAFLGTEDYQDLVKGWIEMSGAHDFPLTNKESIKLMQVVGNEQVAANNSVDFWESTLSSLQDYDTTQLFTEEEALTINRLAAKGLTTLKNDGLISPSNENVTPEQGLQFLVDNTTKSNAALLVANATNSIDIFSEEQGLGNLSFSGKLPMLTLPSLFLYGELDLVVPPALGQQAHDLVSSEDKKMVRLPKCGHLPFVEAGAVTSDEIIEFVERNK